jgi:hypothetical protein
VVMRLHSHVSEVQQDFDCLLDRMRHRLYPETMPVLAFYWLRTICEKGYQEPEWTALDRLLRHADQSISSEQAFQSIVDLREWIVQTRHRNHQPSTHSVSPGEQTREVTSDALVPYVFRLLNEWLPVEAANLLIREPVEGLEQPGIPGLFVARAIERLLLREHLSRAALESMLAPGLLSPRIIYPGDWEIFQDVVLFLTGRTAASAFAKLPAVLVCVAPESPLSPGYSEAVGRAILTTSVSGAEELHVPIATSQAKELLTRDHIRITSTVVTMDGQLWQADKLQRAEKNAIVYRPAGRLRIDYSEDHARIVMPWLEAHGNWSGPVSFTNRPEVFGREWRISHWEQDGEHTLLHLEFVACLPLTAVEPRAETSLRRSHPAAIDMAWTALERALEASLAQGNRGPVELLRREELIPLGRALFGLAETVSSWRLRRTEPLERRLNGIRYLSAQLISEYGLIPWHVLPKAVRKILLANGRYGPLAGLLQEVFEGLPEGWGDRVSSGRWPSGSLRRLWERRSWPLGSSSPPRAA